MYDIKDVTLACIVALGSYIVVENLYEIMTREPPEQYYMFGYGTRNVSEPYQSQLRHPAHPNDRIIVFDERVDGQLVSRDECLALQQAFMVRTNRTETVDEETGRTSYEYDRSFTPFEDMIVMVNCIPESALDRWYIQ